MGNGTSEREVEWRAPLAGRPEVVELLIGTRPASAGIQIVALVLGLLSGLVVLRYIGILVMASFSPSLGLAVAWLSIAFAAYSLAAPATWRGASARCSTPSTRATGALQPRCCGHRPACASSSASSPERRWPRCFA